MRNSISGDMSVISDGVRFIRDSDGQSSRLVEAAVEPSLSETVQSRSGERLRRSLETAVATAWRKP